MQGTILDYSTQTRTGIISTAAGDRVSFTRNDWKASVAPIAGRRVDFVSNPDGTASEIYTHGAATASGGMSGSMKKAIIAGVCAVLAFFVPVLGLILAIAGLVIGRQARAAAKIEDDDTAAMIALVAIIVGVISLLVAAFMAFTMLVLGGGMMTMF